MLDGVQQRIGCRNSVDAAAGPDDEALAHRATDGGTAESGPSQLAGAGHSSAPLEKVKDVHQPTLTRSPRKLHRTRRLCGQVELAPADAAPEMRDFCG